MFSKAGERFALRLGTIAAAAMIVAGCAATRPPATHCRIALRAQPQTRVASVSCATRCGGSGVMECLRRCPGVEVTEGAGCEDDDPYTVCYSNERGVAALGPQDEDNAARAAIAVLRGMAEADDVNEASRASGRRNRFSDSSTTR